MYLYKRLKKKKNKQYKSLKRHLKIPRLRHKSEATMVSTTLRSIFAVLNMSKFFWLFVGLNYLR